MRHCSPPMCYIFLNLLMWTTTSNTLWKKLWMKRGHEARVAQNTLYNGQDKALKMTYGSLKRNLKIARPSTSTGKCDYMHFFFELKHNEDWGQIVCFSFKKSEKRVWPSTLKGTERTRIRYLFVSWYDTNKGRYMKVRRRKIKARYWSIYTVESCLYMVIVLHLGCNPIGSLHYLI